MDTVTAFTQFTVQTSASTVHLGPRPVPDMSQPSCFLGETEDYKTFLTQCEIHFKLQPDAVPSDRAKVAYIITHLRGRAEA